MKDKVFKAIEAIEEAQKIAFAPFLFQATVSMRKLGIFDLIFERRRVNGIRLENIAKELELSTYGVGVLLEIAESSNIVRKDDEGRYELTKLGYFLSNHKTVSVNIDFTNEVCYKGLFHLDESIKKGKPVGLKELGEWKTIYEGLASLTPKQREAWFGFDHHYSDYAFDDALQIVFENKPRLLFDIGGNTGKFALKCCRYDTDVVVKILDLPGQLKDALQNAKENGFEDRIFGVETDLLSDDPKIPLGADAIWMSQFLDCFSKEEIVKILTACERSMSDKTEVLIMETFTDRQRFDNAKFSLEATSLYFTALANGNSKMYKAIEMIELVEKSGLRVEREIRRVGENHTILVCKKK